MADLEKVLNGLEHCTSAKYPYPCNGCVYRYNIDYNDPWSCRIAVMRDALGLLKEQEKTKVIFSQDDGSIETVCGNCGFGLDKTYSVCPKCGKELDWNG